MRTHRFVSGTHRRLSFKFWFALHLSALILLLDPATVHAQTQRKSVMDLTATDLMSLRRGVANMTARNSAPHGSADFRRKLARVYVGRALELAIARAKGGR